MKKGLRKDGGTLSQWVSTKKGSGAEKSESGKWAKEKKVRKENKNCFQRVEQGFNETACAIRRSW